MGNNDFIFQISSYNVDNILPQVSKALEKRTELVSRERYPGLWKNTDKFNSATQGRTQGTLRTRIRSIACLAVGIFLFVPGIMNPKELFVTLLVGAIAIGVGIRGLVRSKNHKKNPFDKSAKLLLDGKDTLSTEQSIEVSFSENGMMIPTDNSDTECVPYDNFECIIETTDLFLLVYDTRATVLQKLDLTTSSVDDFRNFISEKVTKYQVLT